MSEQDKPTQIALEDGSYETRLTRKFMLRKPYEKHNPRVIKAVIPGAIERIDTVVGARVQRGDTLMILEAMKMHNQIKAPYDGRIRAVSVTAGEKVTKGQTLLEME